jgi:transposase InsO family protein
MLMVVESCRILSRMAVAITESPKISFRWEKLRDELHNREVLDMLAEAKVLVEGWRKEYNHFRPHGSLGYRPPAPEAFMAGKFTQGLAH